MAIVKADGYGHGAITVANAAIQGGANELGIATLKEGIELRESGIKCPILVLGNLIDEDELKACLSWDLMPTISSLRETLICKDLAEKAKNSFGIQLKIDTGMSRLGCEIKTATELITLINSEKKLILKGIYSHLALADDEDSLTSSNFTYQQLDIFKNAIKEFSGSKVCCHLANSAGTLKDQSLHLDMVRVGLSIYGYNPFKRIKENIELKPALAVKARITLIRNVPKGVGISYGHNFITQRPSRLAVVGIGYADGINRSLSGKISVLCKGRLVPQVGAITMDQMIIDITDSPEITLGSVVTLLGREGKYALTAKKWCELSGSIPWEILCAFKNRLPRIVI